MGFFSINHTTFYVEITIMAFLCILSICVEWRTQQVRALLRPIKLIHQDRKMKMKSIMRIKIRALLRSSFTWVTGLLLGFSNNIDVESIVNFCRETTAQKRVVGTEMSTGTIMTTWGLLVRQSSTKRAEAFSIVFLQQLQSPCSEVPINFDCNCNKMWQGWKKKSFVHKVKIEYIFTFRIKHFSFLA